LRCRLSVAWRHQLGIKDLVECTLPSLCRVATRIRHKVLGVLSIVRVVFVWSEGSPRGLAPDHVTACVSRKPRVVGGLEVPRFAASRREWVRAATDGRAVALAPRRNQMRAQ